MLYETLGQGREFAAMVGAGAAMGAVSAGFAGLRRLMQAGKWLSLACDCAMGLVWGAEAAGALFMACRGEARAYHFLAMAAGGFMFMAGISPAARGFFGKCGRMVRKMAEKMGWNRVLRAIFR